MQNLQHALNIDDCHIHIREFLTTNILIRNDEQFHANSFDMWALCARVFITTDVHERLDRSKGPAEFVGHLTWQSLPFHLHEYANPAYAKALHAMMIDTIHQAIRDGKYTPITDVALRHNATQAPVIA